jgi:seryl-tRNA synthetase
MNTAAWTGLISGAVVALIALYGTVRTAKVAKLSNDRMAAIDGWQQWRTDAQELRKERDALNERIGKIKAECDQRADELATELALVEARLDGCVIWIRAVMPAMRDRGIAYPPIPAGITDTDPGFPPVRRLPRGPRN